MAISTCWQTEVAEDLVIGCRQAAAVVTVEVDLDLGTVGETVAVIFIQLVENTGVPAKALGVAVKMGDLRVGRDLRYLARQRRRQRARASDNLPQIASIALDLRLSVDRVKA